MKIVCKDDIKTTQNPQKQPPGGALKKVVLKIFANLAVKIPVSESLF